MGKIEAKSRFAPVVRYFSEGESEFTVPNLLTTYTELEIGTEFIIENSAVDPDDGAMKLFERRRYRVVKLVEHNASTNKRLYKLSDLVRDGSHTGMVSSA